MLTIAAAHKPMRGARSMALARAWKIESRSSIYSPVWRFTDAPVDTRVREKAGFDILYSAFAPVYAQPIRRQSGMRDNSSELIVTANAGTTPITEEQVELGLLDRARVTEYHFDWMHPWTGAIAKYRWYVGDVQGGPVEVKLSLRGLTSRFMDDVGEVIEPTCQNKFLDDLCDFGTSISGNPDFDFIEYEVESNTGGGGFLATRRQFRLRGVPSTPPTAAQGVADWWGHGILKFIDGPCAGMQVVVESNTQPQFWAPGPWWFWEVALATPTPYAPEHGDRVLLRVGCSRTSTTCDAKFGNFDNFRGQHHIAGSDTLQKTPGAS